METVLTEVATTPLGATSAMIGIAGFLWSCSRALFARDANAGMRERKASGRKRRAEPDEERSDMQESATNSRPKRPILALFLVPVVLYVILVTLASFLSLDGPFDLGYVVKSCIITCWALALLDLVLYLKFETESWRQLRSAKEHFRRDRGFGELATDRDHHDLKYQHGALRDEAKPSPQIQALFISGLVAVFSGLILAEIQFGFGSPSLSQFALFIGGVIGSIALNASLLFLAIRILERRFSSIPRDPY